MRKRKLSSFVVIVFVVLLFIFLSISPTNNANWSTDQKVLPRVKIKDNFVIIYDIRNFTYRSTSDYVQNYYDRAYDVNKIKSVDYIVEPFGDFGGAAHTFLSFGFEDGSYVAVSVEIRKKKGQLFSPWKGLLKQYTLTYVIADERDVIKLRANYRKDKVYVYPTKIDKTHAAQLFLSMMHRAEKLYNEPEFYNTLTNTCTTNIVRHVNEISETKVPFSYRVLMPGYSDKLAYDLGLLDTTLPYEKIRERYQVNEKAMKYADDKDFSRRIRE